VGDWQGVVAEGAGTVATEFGNGTMVGVCAGGGDDCGAADDGDEGVMA